MRARTRIGPAIAPLMMLVLMMPARKKRPHLLQRQDSNGHRHTLFKTNGGYC